MSKDKSTPKSEMPRAITGAGGVAPDYAVMTAGDVETRAGSVAPNYAVAAEAATAEPAQVVESQEANEPK
jgi:hypothetical protein